MKLSKLLLAIPLLGVLSGCSESAMSEQGQNPNYSIRFSVTAGKQTKASVVDNTTVKDTPFGLFAYSNAAKWADFKAGNDWAAARPNVMYNQLVHYDQTSQAWTYDPLKFWSTENYSFFGYWPMNDKFIATNGGAYANAGELPTIEFKQDVTDPSQMADFVVAHELDKTKEDNVVTLQFKHVLTRLNFKARLDDDLGTTTSASTKVLVHGLRILGTKSYGEGNNASGDNADSKFYSNGKYVLADDDTNGKWDLTNATQVEEPLDVANILRKELFEVTDENGATSYRKEAASVNLDGTTSSLLATNQYLFLIPPQGSDPNGIANENDIKVQVDYDVLSVDPNLPEGYNSSSTTETVSLPVGKLLEGKAYNIIFTFGLHPIKVAANVVDWENEGDVNAPSEEAKTADAAGIKAAWKNLNTIKASDVNVKYFVINMPSAPTADLDLSLDAVAGHDGDGASSTFTANDIKDFTTNDQIELKMLDGSSINETVNVKLPEGWSFVRRTVGTDVHYIIIKATTKTGATIDAWNNSTWSSNMGGSNAENGKNN